MSGILDGKERIFDTILTKEGRRQIAAGELKATFVSFTDSSAIYETDTIVSGGSIQATNRFVLEAGNTVHDQVTLEADDAGLLQAFPISGSERYVIRQGQILSATSDGVRTPFSGSQFTSTAENLLECSIDNFKNLYILKSPDPLDSKEREFLIGPTSTKFTITKENPIPSTEMQTAKLDEMETLFYDKRLSHVPNFEFLPPVNAPEQGSNNVTPLGRYVSLNQQSVDSYAQVFQEIEDYDQRGYGTTVNFTETSRGNNVFCQFFELSNGKVVKLDVIDFGEFTTNKGTKHVFYAGKVFTDSMGAQTFVNMFTLVFEN